MNRESRLGLYVNNLGALRTAHVFVTIQTKHFFYQRKHNPPLLRAKTCAARLVFPFPLGSERQLISTSDLNEFERNVSEMVKVSAFLPNEK